MQVLEADAIDFAKYMLPEEKGEQVKPASEWCQAVIDRLHGDHGSPCAVLPWGKTHGLMDFRPSEVTLWPGMNGHGKSLVTSHVMLNFMEQGERVCIASFEMKPASTMQRMTRQAAAKSDFSIQYIRDFHAWTDGRLWLYDQQGTVQADRMIAVARYCATQLRINHLVIDSLMKCVKGEDDYNGQKDFVDMLCSVARDTGLHVHLVHHARKQANEETPPGKYDAKGSGSITDQVDNVLTVWRNKRKEAAQAQGKPVDSTEPDALLICDKQRNGEWEGRIALWFDKPSMRYMGERGQLPHGLDIE